MRGKLFALVLFSVFMPPAHAQNSTCGAMGAWSCSGSAPHAEPAKEQPAKARPCLIVKHKGTVGRRLIWTALILVPIAPGSKYDYVDSIDLLASKMAYKGKELQELQATGVHVVVLNKNYSATDLEDARKSCRESFGSPDDKGR